MSRRSPRPKCWRAALLALMGLALVTGTAALIVGCSDSRKSYEMLSLFFDGVPDPSRKSDALVTQRTGAGGRPVYIHQPYAMKLCNSCHPSSADIFARAKVRADVCLDCHANVQGAHPVMHGPVMGDACRMCHSPHQSSELHLLKQSAPKVCTQCHEPDIVGPMHREPIDARKTDCLVCHSGHGGQDHRLLKASAPGSLVAATQPAESTGGRQ